MLQTITITPKWQIYLPVKIREELDLEKPGKATIEVRDKKIIVKPQESEVLKLAGKYSHLTKKKKVNLDKVRDLVDFSQI